MRVRLRARVVSPSSVVSPWSGLRAALVRWSFFAVRRSNTGSHAAYMRASTRLLASGSLGADLMLCTDEGVRVSVPLERARFAFASRFDPGEPVLRPIPALFRETVAAHPTGNRTLHYREQILQHGDEVVLEATLVPSRSGRGGPFRATPDSAWAIDANASPVTVWDGLAGFGG